MVRIHIPLFMTDLTDRLLEIVMGADKSRNEDPLLHASFVRDRGPLRINLFEKPRNNWYNERTCQYSFIVLSLFWSSPPFGCILETDEEEMDLNKRGRFAKHLVRALALTAAVGLFTSSVSAETVKINLAQSVQMALENNRTIKDAPERRAAPK